MINPDEVRIVFVGLGMVFPPRPRFRGTALPDLYAAISDRHSFENFKHDDDSAHLSQESFCDVEIRRDRLEIERNSGGVETISRDFADIASIVKSHLDLRVFWEPRIEIRALWDVPGDDGDGDRAGSVMRKKTVNLADDQLSLLDVSDVHAVALEIEATDDRLEHGRHVSLEIGPYLPDPTQLHIVCIDWQHAQIETPMLIEQRIQEAHKYFEDRVISFVSSLMPE